MTNAHGDRGFAAVVALVAAAGGSATDPPAADQVAGLVRQLGHDKYATREAAGRELEAIGEPALGALRQAAASPDPEVRARSERVIGAIAARAGARELAKWAGSWKTPDGVWMKIDGHRWSSGTPSWGPVGGSMWVVEVGPAFVAADMLVEFGPTQGQTCRAIYGLDGDRLRYCGTYMATRATEFKAVAGYYLAEFDREKKK
jgi:hypothetical protein